MTAVGARPAARVRPAAGGRRRRLATLVRTEARLLWRFQVVASAVGVTGLWVVILRLTPADVRQAVTPAVLLTDVTALGFLFVPALLVLERTEGAWAALRLTPVRTGERVGVRVGLTAGLSVAAAAVLCLATGAPDIGVRLLGVATLSALFGLLAVALTAGAGTLTAFLLRAPLVAAPLLAPALLALSGLVDVPALHVSPVTSAVDLLRGDLVLGGLAWQVTWIVGLALLASHVADRPAAATRPPAVGPASDAGRGGHWLHHGDHFARAAAIRSFARADRRALLRDGLLLMLLASVPLVALAMRAIATVGDAWLRDRHGVALAPFLPLLEALLLTVHTPVILGSLAGLLLLEDRDAGLFGPLAATRAGLASLVGYRLGAVALGTSVALLLTLPWDGVAHPAGPMGVAAVAVAAGAVSAVPALAMAAVASNRVQGVAVMKLLGLPLYLPLALWVVPAPTAWVAAPLPTAWLVQAAWAPTGARAVVYAVGAVLVSAAWAVLLGRRFARRAAAV